MTGATWPGSGVRPTLRCVLEDLQLPLPTADELLENLQHELISKAQMLPEFDAAGSAERIASVQDHIWLKVKTGSWRGAVLPPARDDTAAPLWWLGAAGHRQADSDQRDFYARFAADCERRGSALGRRCDSDAYLPTTKDAQRLDVERALAGIRASRSMVRSLARESLQSGHARTATLNGWDITVLIRTDGTRHAAAYIVICTSGVADPKTYAALLSAVPGVAAEDWMPEPTEVLGITAGSGQVVYSALISAEAQALLLAE